MRGHQPLHPPRRTAADLAGGYSSGLTRSFPFSAFHPYTTSRIPPMPAPDPNQPSQTTTQYQRHHRHGLEHLYQSGTTLATIPAPPAKAPTMPFRLVLFYYARNWCSPLH